MQLRHISPGSSDWVDAMDEGGRGWEKLGPEERTKLRVNEYSAVWGRSDGQAAENDERVDQTEDSEDYGWGEPASR
jgi:hypothetical protein